MKTLTKLSLVLALLFVTTATFAAPSSKGTDPLANALSLASQSIEQPFKQAVVPYLVTTATLDECCKVTCSVEVSFLGIITIGVSWCCVPCPEPKKPHEQ